MRKSTSLMSQWQLGIQEGESLHFENCKGGYFPNNELFGLNVTGKSAHNISNGKNLFSIPQTKTVSQDSLTITYDKDEQTITLNGISTIMSSISLEEILNIPLKQYSYYSISAYYVSGRILNADGAVHLMFGCFENDDQSASSFGKLSILYLDNQSVNISLEEHKVLRKEAISSQSNDYISNLQILFFQRNENGLAFDNFKFKIQIENNEYGTDYEPNYSGEAAPIQCVKQGSKVIYRGKNLVPFPYTYGTQTINGVTFEPQEDGSIIVNGTATAEAVYYIRQDRNGYHLPVGSYTLSGSPEGGGTNRYHMQKSIGGVYGQTDNGQGITFELTENNVNNNDFTLLYIRIYAGYTAENLVFKPQIELGNKKTEYEKYISNEITTPSDLYAGDVWYPISGKVYRQNGTVEEYEPQPIFAPQGTVNVMQEPIELTANLSATHLIKNDNSFY